MEIKRTELQNDNHNLIFDILLKYVRHWKWFVVSVFTCLLIGVLSSLMSEEEYSVSIFAMLNQGDSSKEISDSKLEALGFTTTVTNFDNEIIILSSPDVMALVVDALHLDVSYYTKNVLGKHTYLYSEAPYKVYYTQAEIAASKITMSIRKNNSIYIIDGTCFFNNNEVLFKEELKELPVTIALPQNLGTLSIGLSGKDISANAYYVQIDKASKVANELSSKLYISTTSKLSSILDIKIHINNTEKGAAILEELIRKYNEKSVNERNLRAYNTSMFINERLKEISNELNMVEDSVVEFKQRNRIADLSSETNLYMQQSGEYEKQRVEAETQLRIISMVEQFVSENKERMIPSLGVNDPTLAQAISEYNNNLSAYERLLKSTSENNPSRVRLQKELETTRYSILRSIQNERKSIRIALSNIYSQGSSVKSRIQSVPQQRRGLLEKERQQQVIENLFLFLMQKREESNIAMASATEKAKIIISPSKGSIVSPGIRNNLLIFFILGILLPAIILFLLDLFRKKVDDISELRKLAQIKIMGTICHSSSLTPIVMAAKTPSCCAELFRMLRNDIDYHFSHQSNKLILITSSINEEGKSFISINLSIAFTLIGKRVLLVDTDMRKPNLNQLLQSKSEYGLTNYLTQETTQWEDCIEYIDSYPDLHILKAGAIPPNPNELLMSNRFRQFLNEIKNKYDYVFLDSSPIALISDATIVAEYADLTLYVVCENKTPKNMLTYLNEEQVNLRLNNLYFVFNGMTTPAIMNQSVCSAN